MPVSWGTIPSSQATSGYDIEQYCRFFTLHNADLNFARNAGLWTATITANKQVIAESGEHEVLFDAMNECYLIMRGLAQPRK